ncbi:MAG: hypothetical protein PHY56_07880 [Candidatus Omnitrophica bacterium]|nr:hypothetical protein [Candidatus Omnitrophota bacterium]
MDIKVFAKEVSDKKLFRALDSVKIILPGKEHPETQGLPNYLNEYYTDQGLCQVMFEALREEYINREAYEIYEKVKLMKK